MTKYFILSVFILASSLCNLIGSITEDLNDFPINEEFITETQQYFYASSYIYHLVKIHYPGYGNDDGPYETLDYHTNKTIQCYRKIYNFMEKMHTFLNHPNMTKWKDVLYKGIQDYWKDIYDYSISSQRSQTEQDQDYFNKIESYINRVSDYQEKYTQRIDDFLQMKI